GGQYLSRLFFETGVYGGVRRRHRLPILDEIAQRALFFVTDRGLERYRLLDDAQHLADLVERHLHLHGDLFRRGLASELLHQIARRADDLVDRFDHVDGNADGAGLIGDGPADRLADPPRGVRRKFVAALILEFFYRTHQSDVAFLYQIEKS